MLVFAAVSGLGRALAAPSGAILRHLDENLRACCLPTIDPERAHIPFAIVSHVASNKKPARELEASKQSWSACVPEIWHTPHNCTKLIL